MVRENWTSWRFWRWWWRDRVPTDAKLMAAGLVVVALLAGGYFASGGLSGASAANRVVLQTTVTKVVTLKDHGRTIVKRVPVSVSRTVASSSTAYDTVVETQVVTKPGGVRYVPVVKGRTVRNDVTSVVTNEQTVTQPVTVTQTQTETQTQTVVQTVTQPAQTVTVTVPLITLP